MLALTLGPKDRGGCDRGRFEPGAATVPFRSSRVPGDPQRPGCGGGGRAESIDRCAAAPQPSRKHPLWFRRRQTRTGSWLPQLGGAVLSPAGSWGDHADSSPSARGLLSAGSSLRDPPAQGADPGGHARAPDSALQVLRLPDGVVAGARASATRCPAHPATGSAPHRAGGSTYVRSVTLQRRTWRGAVGIALPPYMKGHDMNESRIVPVFQILAEDIHALGIRAVFGLMSDDTAVFAVTLDGLGVKFVGARHENNALAMAEGYAYSTGELGVALIGRGPATANGLHAAVGAS